MDNAKVAVAADEAPSSSSHDDGEAAHFDRIVRVFAAYRSHSLQSLARRYDDFLLLTSRHRHLIADIDYGRHLVAVRECIEHNQR